MAGPNYHFAVLNDLKKKTASSESRVLNFKYPAKHGQGRAVTAISLTSFAVTEFLLKLDCQLGIHPKILK